MFGNLNVRKMTLTLLALVALIILISMSSSLFETNKAGFYQIKQAAFSGNMTVRNTPGVYGQLFGAIHTYQISDMNYFSKSDLDGGKEEKAAAIKIRFNDGGTAMVSGAIKFRLSTTEKDQLTLHEDFKSFGAVQADLIRQVVTEALMQTATLMKAEESYSTRRAEFVSLAESQVRDGIFETVAAEFRTTDAEGNFFIERSVKVKLDKSGAPLIKKVSPFKRYNIEILQFVIKDLDQHNQGPLV